MEMKAFADKVRNALKKELSEGTEVRISKVRKNNGIELHGVSVFRPGENVTPTVYLEDYLVRYRGGEPFAEILRELKAVLDSNRLNHTFSVEAFARWEQAKERIVYKLINANKNSRLLEEVPHVLYLDLAVVFYYLLSGDNYGNASILINHKHREQWDVSEEELYAVAKANTRKLMPQKLQDMEALLREIILQDVERRKAERPLGEDSDKMAEEMLHAAMADKDVPLMYVLTNRQKYFGAACMLYTGLLKEIAGQLGHNLFILPSSVHELILLPDKGMDTPERLCDMVREVNETQVSAEEVLSDNVYYYNSEEDRVCVVRQMAEAQR